MIVCMYSEAFERPDARVLSCNKTPFLRIYGSLFAHAGHLARMLNDETPRLRRELESLSVGTRAAPVPKVLIVMKRIWEQLDLSVCN